MDNIFRRVKGSIKGHADAVLAEYGVKHHKEGQRLKGEWTTGYLCPFCGDKSGSASFTFELYLKCHQCGTKSDVFDWISRLTGKKPWDVCKDLAKRISIEVPKHNKRPHKGMPRMNEAVLDQAIIDLWEHPEAVPARTMLAERRLDDPGMLAELGVGWVKGGWIIFTSRNEAGQLMERYRGWNPNSKAKWMWLGSGSGGPGIWPTKPAPDSSRVLLLEGESDVLTALIRLRLHEQGWHVCTWTAGATSSPGLKDIHRSFNGKEVHICYDNDVFQGDRYNDYFVNTKPGKTVDHARTALEQRLRNLLNRVIPTFESLECKVFVRQCPIDPREIYGGDFRDWVNKGGSELGDWKCYDALDLPTFGKDVVDAPFDYCFDQVHKLVRTRLQAELVAGDDIAIPKTFKMECEMGQHPSCALCPGARLFPDRVIDMEDYQRELTIGLQLMSVNETIVKHVVQRPFGCPHIEVVPLDVKIGSEWKGARSGGTVDTTQRLLHIFSSEPPSLSGEMEIEGYIYPNAKGNGVVMMANSVKSLDKVDVDIKPQLADFMRECPAFSDDVDLIHEYFELRHRDLAFNVTQIYGRGDIHIAHDLMMHSVLRAKLFGAVQRAWLDICVFGDTRTGKSLTFRRLMDYHGLGQHYTAVSNVSRAGLIMGADKQGMLKPGLIPRSNGKALMIDEFHFLVQNELGRAGEHPMSWMQGARDEGVVSGVKIYGSRDLPAATRLAILANWMRNKRRIYEFPCQHLGALYGSPETLARLDFALAVEGRPSQDGLDSAPQFWNRDRLRTLALRAWSQDASQVHVDPECFEQARDHCSQWRTVYDSEALPLFTPEEKQVSIMRIAIAVANVCFSHPKGDPLAVHVRPVHVSWAAWWLEQTWIKSGYDRFSAMRKSSREIQKPFDVERTLTLLDAGGHGMNSDVAANMLAQLMDPFTFYDVPSIIGHEPQFCSKWISKLQALRVFERTASSTGHPQFMLTKGGERFMKEIIEYARGDGAVWDQRQNALRGWTGGVFSGDKVEPIGSGNDYFDAEATPF